MLYDLGLKAREEMLNDLRFLFRYEEQLIREGFYTEAEFFDAVADAIEEAINSEK